MYIPLNQLPASARTWVYQAARDLTPAETELAEGHLRAFCESWAAHGQPLPGLPSGCSIDSSVGALRTLSAALGGLDLLDKSQIPYAQTDGSVGTIGRAELRAAVADGRLQPDTPVFDTLVPTLGDLRAGWRKPAAATWLARYFSAEKNAR